MPAKPRCRCFPRSTGRSMNSRWCARDCREKALPMRWPPDLRSAIDYIRQGAAILPAVGKTGFRGGFVGGKRFRLKPCTLAAAGISLLFASSSPWANPTGPQVVSGQVNFQQPNASVLNVTNSPGAIINWQGFSIGASEVTRFVQQSAASTVLNRVTGGNISQIYGQLLSNGRVFLINPGGIVVGPGAIVDTAGFVGSTLNMLDSDFLAGKLRFENHGSAASIVNKGWIRTGYGGQVVLVAPAIENGGLIETPGGELILAAGQKVTISSLNTGGVEFEVQAPTDSVLNFGKLLADGGAVGVFAGTLRHSGEIRANSLAYDEAGRVVLKAQSAIQVDAGSATSADGKTGGSITVQSGGSTRIAGSVSATGSTGNGGSVQLLGNRVELVENAAVGASGATAGGQILVGGDYQGANAAIQNSTNTFVGPAATLRADATQNGDGGRVIVWSDDKAQFYGSLSAQGGPSGGNGGFAEVSGKEGLVFQGGANVGAPRGRLGTLLLDPLDLYVFGGGGIDSTILNPTTDLFPDNAATVSPGTLAAIVGDVTLHARRYMLISSAVTVSGAFTATVDSYTGTSLPALPDPLALSVSSSSGWINGLHLGANITAGGQVNLTAPIISSVAASTVQSTGAGINLTAGSQAGTSSINLSALGAVKVVSGGTVNLGTVNAGSFEVDTASSVNTTGITTSGTVDIDAASGNIFPGTIAAGSGSVVLDGGFISATVNTTGSVTAIGTSSVTIGSTGDLNVANVQSGFTASLTPSGSILGIGASPLVKGINVTLTPGTGGQIVGPGGAALPVEVQSAFSFSPKGAFNIQL